MLRTSSFVQIADDQQHYVDQIRKYLCIERNLSKSDTTGINSIGDETGSADFISIADFIGTEEKVIKLIDTFNDPFSYSDFHQSYLSSLQQIIDFTHRDSFPYVIKEFSNAKAELKKIRLVNEGIQKKSSVLKNVKEFQKQILSLSSAEFIQEDKFELHTMLLEKFQKHLQKLHETNELPGQSENLLQCMKVTQRLRSILLVLNKSVDCSIAARRSQHSFRSLYEQFFKRYLFNEFIEDLSEFLKDYFEEAMFFSSEQAKRCYQSICGFKPLSPDGNICLFDLQKHYQSGSIYDEIIVCLENLLTFLETFHHEKEHKHTSQMQLLQYTLLYFKKPALSNEMAKKAILAIHMRVSLRTIDNWNRDKNIYSKQSAKEIHKLMNKYAGSVKNMDSRRITHLWMCYQLKLTVDEADIFLLKNNLSTKLYVLDIREVMIFSGLLYNEKNPKRKNWNFFEVLHFSNDLEEQILKDSENSYISTIRTTLQQWGLEISENPSAFQNIADYFKSAFLMKKNLGNLRSALYAQEKIFIDSLRDLYNLEDISLPDYTINYSTYSIYTKMVEIAVNPMKSNHYGFLKYPEVTESLEDWKRELIQWFSENKQLFTFAYFSHILYILDLFSHFIQTSPDDPAILDQSFVYLWTSLLSENKIFAFDGKDSGDEQKNMYHIPVSHVPVEMFDRSGQNLFSYKLPTEFSYKASDIFANFFESCLDFSKPLNRKTLIQLIIMCHLDTINAAVINQKLDKLHFEPLNPFDKKDLLLILFLELNEDMPLPGSEDRKTEMAKRFWLLDFMEQETVKEDNSDAPCNWMHHKSFFLKNWDIENIT